MIASRETIVLFELIFFVFCQAYRNALSFKVPIRYSPLKWHSKMQMIASSPMHSECLLLSLPSCRMSRFWPHPLRSPHSAVLPTENADISGCISNQSKNLLVSHTLLQRAAAIRRMSTGFYEWLPLGHRIMRKLQALVRLEMASIDALELQLPSLLPQALWNPTKRWESFGSQLFKCRDRRNVSFCLGPTHEEAITDLAKALISSYRELPVSVYQITTKFRDELRPRFGLIRSREFIMKDAYSFHLTLSSLHEMFKTFRKSYESILQKLEVDYKIVEVDSGNMEGSYSMEFQALLPSKMLRATRGSQLADNSSKNFTSDAPMSVLSSIENASQINHVPLVESDSLTNKYENDFGCNTTADSANADGLVIPGQTKTPATLKDTINSIRSIEVGHIFQLGDYYSRAFGATVRDKNGKKLFLQMGCYGLGLSRLIAAIVEQNHDSRGPIFPSCIAPFQIVIVPVLYHASACVQKIANELFNWLTAEGIDVLLDDRPERLGAMLMDADSMGIPHRFIINEKFLIPSKAPSISSLLSRNDTPATHQINTATLQTSYFQDRPSSAKNISNKNIYNNEFERFIQESSKGSEHATEVTCCGSAKKNFPGSLGEKELLEGDGRCFPLGDILGNGTIEYKHRASTEGGIPILLRDLPYFLRYLRKKK